MAKQTIDIAEDQALADSLIKATHDFSQPPDSLDPAVVRAEAAGLSWAFEADADIEEIDPEQLGIPPHSAAARWRHYRQSGMTSKAEIRTADGEVLYQVERYRKNLKAP